MLDKAHQADSMEAEGNALAVIPPSLFPLLPLWEIEQSEIRRRVGRGGNRQNSKNKMQNCNSKFKNNIYISLVLLSFFFSGCGIYSFSGSSLGGVKTIAVPLFDNQTDQYGIREDLTEKIADRFVQDNTLKVVNEKIADSILHGTIIKYLRESHTFDENENIKEYIVRIWVKVSFEEKKNKKIIWKEDNLLGWGIYSAQDETEDLGRQRAIEKLAEDIVNKTVKGW
jgi:hypothetical protein